MDSASAALRRVARGGALNTAAAALGAGLNVLLVVVVARGVDQGTAGMLFAATAVFLMTAATANLGTPNGLVYFVARLRAQGRGRVLPDLLRLALTPACAAAVAAAAGLALAAPALGTHLGGPEAAHYLRLLALFLPFAVLLDAFLAAGRGHHAMAPTAAVDKLGRPAAQVLLLGAAIGSGAAGLLAVAWAGPYLPAAALAWWWLRRLRRRHSPDSGEDDSRAAAPTPREFWSFTLPRGLANIAQVGIQRSGIVLVAALADAAQAAVFTAATRFVVLGQLASQAVQFAVQPRLTELLAAEDREGAAELYRISTSWLICLTWPLYLPLPAAAPLLLGVFGGGYGAGAGVVYVVAATMLLAAACGTADLALTVAGRTGHTLVNNGVSLGAGLLLCLLLIPAFGAVGAACAWAVAVALRNLLALWKLRSLLGTGPWNRTTAVAAAWTGLWFGALPWSLTILGGGRPGFLAVALAVGGLGYAATLWRLRHRLHLDGLLRRSQRPARPTAFS